MHIIRKASAGTMQSSDLRVTVEPSATLRIDLESTVLRQYGHLIRAQIETTLGELGVRDGHFRIADRGALDYAIAARIEAVVERASSGCRGGAMESPDPSGPVPVNGESK